MTGRAKAADGYELAVTRFPAQGPAWATLVVAGAMGVRQDFYAPIARFLAEKGVHVLTFDYRGMGWSRTGGLAACDATVTDWAEKDLNAMLLEARAMAPQLPLLLLGHSLGGQLLGVLQRPPKQVKWNSIPIRGIEGAARMRELRGKVAVVTGAGSGIGRELALACAREGAAVVLADVDARGMQATAELVAAAGGESEQAHCDVSRPEAVEHLAARAWERSAPPTSSSTMPAWRSWDPAGPPLSKTGPGSSAST